MRERKLYKADASDAGKMTISCQIAHNLPPTYAAHMAIRGHVRSAFSRVSTNNPSLSKAEEEEQQLTSRISATLINHPLSVNDQHRLQHGSAQAVHSLYSNAAKQPTPSMLL